MKRFALFACLAAWIPIASADYLIQNSTVTAVTNTIGNEEQFAIRVIGGTGVCVNASWIVFKLSTAASEKIYERAYAAALTALALGTAVNVYDYHDTGDCAHAESIQLLRS